MKAEKGLIFCLMVAVVAGVLACTARVPANNPGLTKTDKTYSATPDTSAAVQVATGRVLRFKFTSSLVDSRIIDVWLPDGYSTTEKYNVLYMHDGQMLFDATTTWNKQEWKVDETLNRLLQEGKLKQTIVVGIANNGSKRHAEFFPQKAIAAIQQPHRSELLALMPGGPKADDYLKFLVTELKPFIDQEFSTYKDAGHTFIAGSSMGGLISLYAISEYPQVFSGAACLSTHWIGTFAPNSQVPQALIQYLESSLPSPDKHKLYFDYGTAGLDAAYGVHQVQVDSLMKKKGYTAADWTTLEFAGADHTENDWAARLEKPLLFLLQK